VEKVLNGLHDSPTFSEKLRKAGFSHAADTTRTSTDPPRSKLSQYCPEVVADLNEARRNRIYKTSPLQACDSGQIRSRRRKKISDGDRHADFLYKTKR